MLCSLNDCHQIGGLLLRELGFWFDCYGLGGLYIYIYTGVLHLLCFAMLSFFLLILSITGILFTSFLPASIRSLIMLLSFLNFLATPWIKPV